MLCSKKAGAHGAEPDDAGSPKGIPPPVRMGFSTGTATLQNKCLGGTGMKHGKRFLWIVPLFCLLAACGGQGTQAEVEDKLTPAEGSSPSTDTDTVIYGDTPEDRIAVTYYDGVVNNISLDETLQTEKTSNWSLQGGITVGSSKEDLDKVYGACTMSNEQDQYFVYYYDSSHTLLTEDHIDDVDYMVSFILEEDGLLACAIGSAEPALEPSSSP